MPAPQQIAHVIAFVQFLSMFVCVFLLRLLLLVGAGDELDKIYNTVRIERTENAPTYNWVCVIHNWYFIRQLNTCCAPPTICAVETNQIEIVHKQISESFHMVGLRMFVCLCLCRVHIARRVRELDVH